MKREKLAIRILGLFMVMLFAVSCAATSDGSTAKAKKAKPYDPTGNWEYIVETPDGGSGGLMLIEGNPGAYIVKLETDQFGVLDLTEVAMEGQTLTGTIEVMGNFADIECTFDGETMSGYVYLGEETYPMEGNRVSK